MGVRSKLYHIASDTLAYRSPVGEPFQYNQPESLDLQFDLMFKTVDNADHFRRRLYDETCTFQSPLSRLVLVNAIITSVNTLIGTEILTIDYNPDDTDSPRNSMSIISGPTTVLDNGRDIWKYQRLESENCFVLYRAESCHIKDNAFYRANPDEFDDPVSNRLALTSLMHDFYDGRNAPIPLFKLEIHRVIRGLDNNARHIIILRLTAYNAACGGMFLHRLVEGSTIKDETTAHVAVQVLDKDIFCKAINWKAANTQREWDIFNNVHGAV